MEKEQGIGVPTTEVPTTEVPVKSKTIARENNWRKRVKERQEGENKKFDEYKDLKVFLTDLEKKSQKSDCSNDKNSQKSDCSNDIKNEHCYRITDFYKDLRKIRSDRKKINEEREKINEEREKINKERTNINTYCINM
jgi:hypothetical protein